MAYTNIDDPSAFFQTTLYTGNGTAIGSGGNVITNNANSGNFKPDWTWHKVRSTANDHQVYDSSRGVKIRLNPNATNSDFTLNEGLQSFDTNGFTVGSDGGVNSNNQTYVAWQWKANGGTTTSVSASGTGEDSINASTHQVNTTAGFSIITYTGRDDQISNGQETKLTHGLGVKPDMFICKKRDGTSDWYVLGANATETASFGWSYNEYLALNTTGAVVGVYYTGNKAADSNYIYLGKQLVNTTDSWIGYAFTSKQGYSKFGKYVGNGNANGPFVYTGFKPAFVMIKIIDTHGGTTGGWTIYDNKRGNNGNNYELFPHSSEAEYTGTSYFEADLLSNGFKIKLTDVAVNGNGKLYGYTAFAENPFVTSTGIPTTAR